MKSLPEVLGVVISTITDIVSPSASNQSTPEKLANNSRNSNTAQKNVSPPDKSSKTPTKDQKIDPSTPQVIYHEFIHKLAQIIFFSILERQSPETHKIKNVIMSIKTDMDPSIVLIILNYLKYLPRENKWFNLLTPERLEDRFSISQTITLCESIQSNAFEIPILSESALSHIPTTHFRIGFNLFYKKNIIEKWFLEIDTSTFIQNSRQTPSHLPRFYKHLIIIIRSLYSFLLFLPRTTLLKLLILENEDLFQCKITSRPYDSPYSTFNNAPVQKIFHIFEPHQSKINLPINLYLLFAKLEDIEFTVHPQIANNLMLSHQIIAEHFSPRHKHRPHAIKTTNLKSSPTPPHHSKIVKSPQPISKTAATTPAKLPTPTRTQTPPPISTQTVFFTSPLSANSMASNNSSINRSRVSLHSQGSQGSPKFSAPRKRRNFQDR